MEEIYQRPLNHVNYNLSESEEIRHKRGEFIERVNGLLA